MMTTISADGPMQAVTKEEGFSTTSETQPAESAETTISERVAWFAVIVAGLGYFVDVFDLWLFANFRVASLTSLGLSPQDVTTVGAILINYQQAGLILGGFAWGMLGDKRGRASVMFGSILIYSLANLLNAFVSNVEQYAVLRFMAGFGLAGEIGAGITLIAEILPQRKRGIGTTIVTCLGVSGAIFAAMAGKFLDWRTAFVVGGVMGLGLLFLRFLVHESGIFGQMKELNVCRGSLRLLFARRERVIRFLSCIAAGVPLYLVFGIFATFAPEVTKALGILEPISVPDVLLVTSIGITLGDPLAGLLSQRMRSRKRPMLIMLLIALLLSSALPLGLARSANGYLVILGLLGLCTGYWACLITTSAENFGTNLRATVTTSVPNLVRGSVIILTASFVWLKQHYDITTALTVLTAGSFFVAFLGLWRLRETFHQDLNFFEE